MSIYLPWFIIGLIAVFFAVHAVRNGRYFWVFLIVLFPVIGCAIYFFAEMLPELRRNAAIREAGAGVAARLDPTRELRRLKEQLETVDTVGNRTALADAYVAAGRHDDAIPLYESCLKGTYENDPVALGGLCRAHFHKRDYETALRLLTRLRALKLPRSTHEFDLLYARSLEALGRNEEAESAYAALVPVSTGEEARVRYGLLLKKLGKSDAALGLFRETVRNAKLSPGYYGKSEKTWIAMARHELGATTDA
jgi:hypothetical protein